MTPHQGNSQPEPRLIFVDPDTDAERRCWCGGPLTNSVHPLYGKCADCGTQVLRRKFTETELQSFYGYQQYWHEHQTTVSGYPAIEQRAQNDFLDRIPVWHRLLASHHLKPRRLLEFGCAHGGFLHYCRQHGCETVVGVEVDEATCEFARKNFGLPHVFSGLFPNVKLPLDQFDVVCSFDVIEHFLDPVMAVSHVSKLLAPDGLCIFQTPCYRGEGADWKQFRPQEHTFLHTEQSIRRLFDRCGLEVLEILPGYFPDDMFVIGGLRQPVAKPISPVPVLANAVPDSSIEKVLLVRTDSIGDAVLASATLEPIRRGFPQAKLAVLCQQHVAELFFACPFVDSIICYDRKQVERDAVERAQILTEIAAFKPDVILNAVRSRDKLSDELTLALRGVQTIGIESDLDNISEADRGKSRARYQVIIPSPGAHQTELQRHADFLRGLGVESPNLQPVVWTAPDDELLADEFFKAQELDPGKTIAVFPGAQHAIRVYDKYAEALKTMDGCQFLIFGDATQNHLAENIEQQLPGRTVNLCGRTSLRETAALLRHCRLYVGAESAGAHIACALGVPNVVLLGGGHFGRFMPYSPLTTVVALPLDCFGCNWRCQFSSAHCITSLAPEMLAAAIASALKGPQRKPTVFTQMNEREISLPPALAVWLDPKTIDVIPFTPRQPLSRQWPSLQYGPGVHKDEGAFRWLDTDAELQVSVPSGGQPASLSFELRAGEMAWYRRAFGVEVAVDGRVEKHALFQNDHQFAHVRLLLPPAAHPHFVRLRTDAFFTTDDRRLAVQLRRVELTEAKPPAAPPTQELFPQPTAHNSWSQPADGELKFAPRDVAVV